MTERESLEVDVLIVGAGPAGLAASIRLKQLALAGNFPLSVCIVEKGSEVGAHILSGVAIDPRALNALIPDWQEKGAPLTTSATEDRLYFLTKRHALRLPVPPQLQNHGNFIGSLENLCKWLAEQATGLGVDIYPGFPAREVLYSETGEVAGIITGDFGRAKDGQPKAEFQPGMEIRARYTLFAEGARGHLSQSLMQRFHLRASSDPQTYGIGIKEIWEIDPAKHHKGRITHTVGWPLDQLTYGGSFIYHFDTNLLSIGYVIGLDYQNPYLDPYEEFQRFKQHPSIRPLLEGGKRLSYGARALNEGGYQSIPQVIFPGGALIGCAAGFLNVPRIKGSHNAMESGMLAAEAVFEALQGTGAAPSTERAGASVPLLTAYPEKLKQSAIMEELYHARNIRPSFHMGLFAGMVYSALDTYLLRGRAPWTFRNHADHTQLIPARHARKIAYPPHDGIVSFDRMASVFISNTNHEENQPVHLTLRDAAIPTRVNLPLYDAPEQRYCPAGVYEIVQEEAGARLQINAQNCVHCKTCDIKDPTQNIVWVTPEGGGGPNYVNM